MINIAINGFGRIGSNIVRAIYEYNLQDQVKVVAINSRSPIETIAHLTRYDSVHGRFLEDVKTPDQNTLIIKNDSIRYTRESDPSKCNWSDVNVDVLLECTGAFRSKESVKPHLQAGAKKVLISAPGEAVDNTIVFGVNDHTIKSSDQVVSNASCTTNCLAPIAKILDENLGIQSGLMTTIHSYTSDQKLIDASHKDLRRARSAAISMIPTKTGAAKAVGIVLPNLKGKIDGFAVRVPTQNVSVVDLTFVSKKPTTIDDVNQFIQKASIAMPNIIGYNEDLLVSIDFNHRPESTIFDATQTRVIDETLVKIMTWYDNEWGFSCRMIDTAIAMHQAK